MAIVITSANLPSAVFLDLPVLLGVGAPSDAGFSDNDLFLFTGFLPLMGVSIEAFVEFNETWKYTNILAIPKLIFY